MKKNRKPPQLERVFTSKQISEAIKQNKVLSLSISLPVGCNLRCAYCWVLDKKQGQSLRREKDISFKEICNVIIQAQQLGLKTISIVGKGEPLMYKKLKQLIRFIDAHGIRTIIFTNGMFLTLSLAKFLFAYKVKIVAKLNSLDRKIQEELTGKGTSGKMRQAIELLIRQGFNKQCPSRLAIHSVIVKQNYKGMQDLWNFCRQNNIIPYLHTVIPANRNDKALSVSKHKLQKLYIKLAEIDKQKYGYAWDENYTYPIPAQGCCVVKAGCAVGSTGNIKMCGYVNDALGNIRNQTISEIMQSPKVRKIRSFKYAHSKKNPHFYGCRAIALNVTQDRFARDPFYWLDEN